ncbi:MAG: histidinol-phosphate transaminase [Victivallales bacterium]|nr:histidinol-phosphate transaminase [Victivallales bacterium]
MTYSRKNISAIAGYVPGEQPRGRTFIKLNTNENPYPPSPAVAKALKEFNPDRLRLYSEPSAMAVRNAAADVLGYTPAHYLIGNGSDDLLTIALRTFVDQDGKAAFTNPSYSLYPVLADLQGAQRVPVELTDDFDLPENTLETIDGATLFLVANPNAPTGNLISKERLRRIAEQFHGVLWIDEAYVDFAGKTCLDLVGEFPNVVVSRTLSKSYSLAGLRLGIACANPDLIFEMNKVKDSYNIDMIAQALAEAAIRDQESMKNNARKIIATRERVASQLKDMGCDVLPSAANFIFVRPPMEAAILFKELREEGFLVRYFNLPRIDDRIRITIGTDEDMDSFVKAVKGILERHR